ncbi:hypothetical protein [Janthinobacterium sp. PSPC3-1]|uniref:hypothetical protein n=1 Tax=Janthinobacterium sp. PSPC3-1 TaxID=2804653 RepID=UPI003CF35C5C
MKKIKIKLVSIGQLPIDFQEKNILKWKSSAFEVSKEIENFSLTCDSDGPDWAFSDELVRKQIPRDFDADFIVAIVNAPIEDNYYSRRLGNNQIVFTFYETKDILEHYNIPIENIVYRMLYAYTLIYKRAGNRIPGIDEMQGLTHDETRACLFDMNGIKTDLAASCSNAKICGQCQEQLRRDRVSNHLIDAVKSEIKKIRKDLYYRAFDFIKKHPLWSLALSSLFAITLGVTGSVTASFLYDAIK